MSTVLFCILLFQFTLSQPPVFNPYDFILDGFEISRGYFKPLTDQQSCETYNYANCIYSNFINPPNILFVPTFPSSTTFTSTFTLDPNDAIVIAGFAPPLATYFTITPYASFTDGIQIFSSISNNSLVLNSEFFVAVITGDTYTFELIQEWFRTANTTLTTGIYNNHLYHLPIVQENNDLHINQNTQYSIIIRHETIASLQDELKYLFSQSPTLSVWKINALNYDNAKSKIVTKIFQIRQQANNEWNIALPVITPYHNHNIREQKLTYFNQNDFNVINYDSFECLSQSINCHFDQPETVVFESNVFNTDKRHMHKRGIRKETKIYVSGINHVSTGNAIYSTINIVNTHDHSILAQIKLNDIITDDKDGYIVVFTQDCDQVNDIKCQEISDINMNSQINIVEILWNNVGIDVYDLQPPNAVISVGFTSRRIRRSKQISYSDSNDDSTSNDDSISNDDDSNDDNRPNILFIFMDDLGFGDVGFNGAEYDTPIIDDLAATGMILNQYYVHPVCTPTRTALYTGRFAFRYNMSIPLDIGQRRYLPTHIHTLAQVLSSNGYENHLVGKWHSGAAYWSNFPFAKGFDSFYGFSGGFIDFYSHQQCWEQWNGKPFPHILGVNNLRLLNAFYPNGLCTYDFYDEKKLDFNTNYFTTLFADRIIDIISLKNKKSKPFFIMYSLGTPHTPIVEPPQLYSECDISLVIYDENRYNYCNMILEADTQIGKVVNELVDNNLWDNTILIFSTDNGAISNADPGNIIYGSFGSNAPLRAQKSSPFEGGTRGIAFIAGGYLSKYNLNGRVNNKLYHVTDWYDTIIYGIAGINYIDNSVGKDSVNIWDSLINDNIVSPRDEWVWTFNFGATPTAIRQSDWKLVLNPQHWLDGYWDVNDKIIAPGQGVESVYLFNITRDELEYNNLKDVYPDIVNDLTDRLLEIQNEGFTVSNDNVELEGMVVAVLSGTSIPYLELTQEITIDVD